jgi:hypothetical protein
MGLPAGSAGVTGELVPAGLAGGVAAVRARISQAQLSLVEARGLPEIRRVQQAATVAAEAARRVARLAEAESAPREIVAAANEAASEAAALRIEAQARAGEVVHEMAERGELATHGGDRRTESRSHAATLIDLGVTNSESSRWQQVAAVPVEVRRTYFDETRSAGSEVTTAGLLRYATSFSAAARTVDHAAIHAMAQRQIRKVHQGLTRLHTYRPDALVAALKPREREELASTLPKLRAWVADVEEQLAAHRPKQSKEVA